MQREGGENSDGNEKWENTKEVGLIDKKTTIEKKINEMRGNRDERSLKLRERKERVGVAESSSER